MKAAIFIKANSPLHIREYPQTDPQPGQALIQLETSGLCGTDIHIWDGAIPMQDKVILGHEYIGRIEAFGTGERFDCLGTSLEIGDLVAVNVIDPCDKCLLCLTGGAASCLPKGRTA